MRSLKPTILSKSEARPIPIPLTRRPFFAVDLRLVVVLRALDLLVVDLFLFLGVAFRFRAPFFGIFVTFRFGAFVRLVAALVLFRLTVPLPPVRLVARPAAPKT